MNTKVSVKKIGKALKRNKARILTVTGIGLGVTAAVMAVKETPAALMDEEDLKLLAEQEGIELTKWDFIKLRAKHYWPSMSAGALAIGCVLTSDYFDVRDLKDAAKWGLKAQEALNAYKEVVKEEVGAKKARKLEDKAAEKQMKADPMNPYNTEFDVNSNGFLCYDANSGRYFKSTWEILNAAVNKVNAMIHDETYAVLNNFYEEVGLKAITSGNDLGWDQDIMLYPTCHMSDGGVEDPDCVVINFDRDPSLMYLCRGY